MSVRRMSPASPKTNPPCHPPDAGRAVEESGQIGFDFSEKKAISEHIADVYAAFQKAVAQFGGVTALAAHLERDLGDVTKRVARAADSKGDIKQAFLDYVGVLATDWEARQVYLFALCDAWGYKHPEQYREPSTEEKYRALMSRLAGTPAGEAILKDAANAGGFDAGAFRR